MKIHAATSTDGYKLSHGSMYPHGTEYVYSNLTPRGDKHYAKNATPFYDGKLVWIGAQGAISEIVDIWDNFFKSDKELVISRFAKRLQGYLGGFDPAVKQMEALHDLGYLPLQFKSLPEGSKVPMGVPVLTVTNTHPDFFWLTNYLETSISAMTWKMATAATVAAEYKAICKHYGEKTGVDDFTISVQCHDFSMRGMSGIEDAARTGFAHLTQFIGTDSLPAMDYADDYYGGSDNILAISVPATEHAVATSNILFNESGQPKVLTRLGAEMEFMQDLIANRFPTGIISYVADSYDFWSVVTQILPKLKSEILARQASEVAPAKLVIRPDSGDPVKVITGYSAGEFIEKNGKYYEYFVNNGINSIGEELQECQVKGAVECLWEIFGGTETSTGHKLLDSHIGLIYGDSITPMRAMQILERLDKKGFASGNVVLGVGSMSYQFHTRDTFGFAVKATHITVNGKGVDIFKLPMGDASKASAKGLLYVGSQEVGELFLVDSVSPESESNDSNMLQTVYNNGSWVKKTTLDEIRSLLD